ncbi:NAC domain [Dillenia turbinata]|uniref:NAC domain n=1 Tax=Dillenia turbinata TaxID=194707 RepID=A0AAN8ZK85_9MAGN
MSSLHYKDANFAKQLRLPFDFDSIPVGYRFCPTSKELIIDYLQKKINGEPLPPNKIIEVNIYDYHPQVLTTVLYKYAGEKEWYFFSSRKRKYRNARRPNRSAGGHGYWKATGKSPNEGRTDWIMYEYRVAPDPSAPSSAHSNPMMLDAFILYKIFKKSTKKDKKKGDENEKEIAEVVPPPEPMSEQLQPALEENGFRQQEQNTGNMIINSSNQAFNDQFQHFYYQHNFHDYGSFMTKQNNSDSSSLPGENFQHLPLLAYNEDNNNFSRNNSHDQGISSPPCFPGKNFYQPSTCHNVGSAVSSINEVPDVDDSWVEGVNFDSLDYCSKDELWPIEEKYLAMLGF